jgi:hypothetical protein
VQPFCVLLLLPVVLQHCQRPQLLLLAHLSQARWGGAS